MKKTVRDIRSSKCTNCNNEIKVGDYAAAGPMKKPFCRKCEKYIYKTDESLNKE